MRHPDLKFYQSLPPFPRGGVIESQEGDHLPPWLSFAPRLVMMMMILPNIVLALLFRPFDSSFEKER